MQQLVFATNNAHKLAEVQAKAGNDIKLLSLDDINCQDDIAETGLTFNANASLKSHHIYQKYKLNCFGDDSGLEIDALNNEPGIYSARYAGTHGNHQANMDKVLDKLKGSSNRKARFRTVISLLWNGGEHFFEGIVTGTIRTERSGTAGFGYDPIFQPDGYNITFAEMSMDEKNSISHRGRAVDLMVAFLNTRIKAF
ncbi:non-canonical purine NTP diphosphatase [Mucilaginibacter phyllosphaerae]|uniref:dITP/XTP pyrophosphatase n=1 Tax=Mucilaginibacter phyllosphaerae TaxID=1812349 RepID=A0A4Y8A9W1_9SPHI|nr:non-canonical purine NTP diphosphatase [Mucilaginibacter phyllosphaerae]MBB3969866.1 XTP/dITP diphosphohydrolase [Mucilaginibacter phyllosphaerae]TEW65240.1 non-canonical purine NTP diphosphatase [Mucilaginibacter phyllosphaerae]GGH17082.1 non-canonical purine NTP pyrophosphatase [Mucilaginibacter phyllosphaerae]